MTDEIRDLFDRAAPPAASPARTADTLEDVRPSFRRARRRHRIRTGMAVATVSILVAGGAVMLLGPTRAAEVHTDPANPTPSGPTEPAPTDGGMPEEAALPATGAPTPTTTEGPTPSSTTQAPTTSAPTPSSTTQAPTTTAPTPSSTTQAPTTVAPPAATETATTPGGSITVSHDGTSITIESIDPAPGFTPDLDENDPTEVKIYFRSDSAEYEIEIRLRDGQLDVDTDA